ncbi:T9SS type B sorting domain-containing protein [Christiangramia sediminis]|uniref:T9SS type B sorting domain-containing protein n=1 Tax=Christiangramia sediminis TaxID=2881336 RepID=A0A9X1LIR0_9FLAO|nr:T9SS type B sorting domain-containing protein [Christiangramia sediminis]MCB7481135.1 T9SS type B sorting domain-containing protein [Christiangramia sediminis]
MILKICLFFLLGLFSINSINAQGTRCSDIEPFCAGDERLTFPNANFRNSNQISGELGPDYGCLDDQPYPAWFFLQIENTGDLSFRISQYENENGTGAPLDVDFVVWGPFDRGEDYCSGFSLTQNKIVDCSYLPDAVEFMSIPDAQANDIYVVVITNFEQVPGYISLEQTNTGAGSTDCSILNLDLGGSISVCEEDQYILDGTTDEDASYEWLVFNENTSQYELIPNENGPTYTVTESGDYRLIVTDEIENKSEQDDVTVTFYDAPLIGELDELAVCREGGETIDLREGSGDLIEPNGNSSNYEVFYYETTQDIEDFQPIVSPQTYPFVEGKTVYAQVQDKRSGCFSETVAFELTTFDFPEYQLPENLIFCVDIDSNILNPVTIGEDLGTGYLYEWYDGNELINTSAILTLNEFPSSEIKVRISHPESGCKLEFVTNPVTVSRAEILSVSISGSDFGDGYTVEATPENIIGEEFAEFEYRLDNGNWQESNIFSNVPPGSHVITSRETNGCGETTSESFFLVGYPRFFSPNSDGYNDTWNLITDSYITIKKLYVFDRYGKLISKLNPDQGKGWDGTYNGQPLPADDYWFRVEFVDEKTGDHREYMSNFTLMR